MKESAASPDKFTIADPAVQECPYDYYRALHENEPVHYDPNTDLWMIASYELAVEALNNWKVFSSAIDMRRDVGGPDTSESDALFEKHPEARGYLRPRDGYQLLARREELVGKLLDDVRREAPRIREGSLYPLAPLAEDSPQPMETPKPGAK